MEIEALIRALSDPAAYPGLARDEAIEVHQTHISVVFLAGSHAYKIKKSVSLGFVDYGTLEKRRGFCEREVQLNRRLAPSVYLGTVPATDDGGLIRIEGAGEVIEWAVKMTRLPEAATLRDRLRRGEIEAEQVESLARRIARFHAQAESSPSISESGSFRVVADNALENLAEILPDVGTTISPAVLARLEALTRRRLESLRPMIEARANRGVPRDGHGDLRLDHVYLFPDREPPDDLVVVDAIEFADRFRHADPVADAAFLAMDLIFQGRADLARKFAEVYFLSSGDAEGRTLLPFYTAYRAAIRCKVEGMKASETEINETERIEARTRARAYWLLALRILEDPERRPCLVLVGGLPGSGKSTLARDLAGRAGFTAIRSDEVRKELAGTSGAGETSASFEQGIYTKEQTDRTYAECLRRAERALFEGQRVVVDASFRTESSRGLFLEAARRWHLPGLLLICLAEPSVIRERLRRREGDASDADWSIFRKVADIWEGPGPLSRDAWKELRTDRDRTAAADEALDMIQIKNNYFS